MLLRNGLHASIEVTPEHKNLVEELVRNGLARVFGTKTVLHDGLDSKTYVAALKPIEEEAKAAKRWMGDAIGIKLKSR